MAFDKEKLLEYLMSQKEWITANQAAVHFGVSVRSVKYNVAALNEDETWVLSSRRGYRLNPDFQKQALVRLHAYRQREQVDSVCSRRDLLLRTLIREGGVWTGGSTNEEGIGLFDLAEMLFVSEATIKADIVHVRSILEQYGLHLRMHGNYYYIDGTEKNRRRMMCRIMMGESDNGFNLRDLTRYMVTDREFAKICQALGEALEKKQYYINDYGYVNLVIHLVIIMDRVRHGYQLQETIGCDERIKGAEYEIAVSIFSKLSGQLKIQFAEQEVWEFSLMIGGQTLPLHYGQVDANNLAEVIKKPVLDIVAEIIDRVNEAFDIDLGDSGFYVKFALHIKNLLLRAQVSHFSNNPYTEAIRNSSPLIYEISVFIANILEEKIHSRIDDNEIAYIAMHIGCVLVEKRQTESIRVLLIIPSYYDLSLRIVSRLMERFGSRQLIIGVLHAELEMSASIPFDLILSTMPLAAGYEQPIIKITPVLTEADIDRIRRELEHIMQQRRYKTVKDLIAPLFNKELFEKDGVYLDERDAIRRMCEQMYLSGMVEGDYENLVWERERMSSTAFGNVAIPHSLHACAKKSCINVAIFSKPVVWGQNRVSAILLLAINPDDQLKFGEIFNHLTSCLIDESNIHRLTKCSGFYEFVEIMSKLKGTEIVI
ncbi:MAG: PRD domain-containing protein [Lachnospiraceae bacterium]|nr:PRD domain-containing protein [Lachnospiraceae bacterium]